MGLKNRADPSGNLCFHRCTESYDSCIGFAIQTTVQVFNPGTISITMVGVIVTGIHARSGFARLCQDDNHLQCVQFKGTHFIALPPKPSEFAFYALPSQFVTLAYIVSLQFAIPMCLEILVAIGCFKLDVGVLAVLNLIAFSHAEFCTFCDVFLSQ